MDKQKCVNENHVAGVFSFSVDKLSLVSEMFQ